MPPMSPRDRLIVALDVPTAKQALSMARDLSGKVGMVKVGLELFCSEGAPLVRQLKAYAPVFLDLKLHDIPETVKRTLEQLLQLNPRLINIHALGGTEMMKAAAEAVKTHRDKGGQTQLLAVTVLTSLDQDQLQAIGLTRKPENQVLHLARMAQDAGCDGVVCSALEATAVRHACGEDFHRLCPGIRFEGGAAHDQSRVVTPGGALRKGATWIVMGRPISQAPKPNLAVEAAVTELARTEDEIRAGAQTLGVTVQTLLKDIPE